MFLRTVKAAGGKGIQHEYVRLVESYREHGKSRQRVVCNLGRKDLLAAHLDALVRLLRGEPSGGALLRAGDVQATGAWDWGPVLVARTLWQALGLEAILAGPGGGALAERAWVLVSNRLCEPTSEHGLGRWLETDFVCDGAGRRWVPQWRPEAERRASRASGLRRVSSRSGTGRSISSSPARPRSSRPSTCGCATCSRCGSTWSSTT